MTGSLAAARLAAANLMPILNCDGSTRRVYLSEDNIVYKVPSESYYWSENMNEYHNICNIFLPAPCAFPAASLYMMDDGMPVIAMEYIQGQVLSECWCDIMREKCDVFCLPDDICDIVQAAGISDTAGFNVIESNGTYFVVDAAT